MRRNVFLTLAIEFHKSLPVLSLKSLPVVKLGKSEPISVLDKLTPPVIQTNYGKIRGKNVKISTPSELLLAVTQV